MTEQQEQQETTFTQADIDTLNAKHQYVGRIY